MKKLLIRDCDFPIHRFFEDLPESAQYINSYAKNMTGYIKSLCEIKAENQDKRMFISVEQSKMEEFYFSSENGITMCKYDKVFYEDSVETTKIIKAVNKTYEAIIKDKKENKTFVLKTYKSIFELFFYHNNILKENFSIRLNDSEKAIYKIDYEIDIKESETFLKTRSNVLTFEDKNHIVEVISQQNNNPEEYEVFLNEKLTNIRSMRVIKNKIVNMDLNSKIIDILPYKILRELEALEDNTIKKVSDFLKEQKELDFLTDDKVIIAYELLDVIEEVKNVIKNNAKEFYQYDHNKFHLIDEIAEDILGQKFNLNIKDEGEHKQLEIKGVVLSYFEGFDYENTTYEKFNLENIYSIYNFMKKEF